MKTIGKLAVGLGALALAVQGWTARAEEGEGPEHDKLVTFAASPAEAGEVELELMYEPTFTLRGTGRFERAARADDHGLTLALTYGLVEDLDVRAEAGWGMSSSSAYGAGGRSARGQGATDTALMARWRVVHLEEERFELALRPGVVIPTGARATDSHPGPGQGFWSLEAGLLATQDAGPFTVNAELTGSLAAGGRRGAERGELRAGLAGGWQALRWLQPELELRYERGFLAGGPGAEALLVLGGLSARLGEHLALAGGAKYAVWGRRVEQEAGGVLSLKWTP